MSGPRRRQQDRPTILPVSEGAAARPFWSVMIPTFNCARFLREALASVLRQAPAEGSMEIVVVDDVSAHDDPGEVVRECGNGRVRFVQNSENLGATRNFNRCLELSRGELVHILHGDDFVAPGFYREIESLLERCPECAFFATGAAIVDRASNVTASCEHIPAFEPGTSDASSILMKNPFRTPAVVVRRSFYERNGGFDPELVHCSDWEMWVRAIRFGRGAVSSKPLAGYRVFQGNDSSRLVRSGEAIRDHLRIAERFDGFDGFDRKKFVNGWAKVAFYRAQWFLRRNELDGYQANIQIYREVLPAWRRKLFEIRRRRK